MKNRFSGILMHITSLPNSLGIGTLGKEAYEFTDFLASAGQKIWQVLPLGHTGYGDSPYQCYSAFAGNPLLIDLTNLLTAGYLNNHDIETIPDFTIQEFDTAKVSSYKMPLLYKAAEGFLKNADSSEKEAFDFFCGENLWLDDYALFMVLKKKFDRTPWYLWDEALKFRNPEALSSYRQKLDKDLKMIKVIQFFFFRQWAFLKTYANEKGISIFGDIPLYVSHDSADVWAHHDLFQLDDSRKPTAVAGVPPDYFSADGQLWGNPLFNWAVHEESGFKWWLDRIKASFKLYDLLRIDHFRGLSTYWAVPFGEKTAAHGTWHEAPGKKMLEVVFGKLGDVPLIAEDLGILSPDVESLRDAFKLPGMKVLQFAFDQWGGNNFMPHLYDENCVVYTGTHDNETTKGWFKKMPQEQKEILKAYYNIRSTYISWDMIRIAWMSVAKIAIAPMQDILNLGSTARMNTPGKPYGSWRWRMSSKQYGEKLKQELKSMTALYDRLG